MQLQAFLKYDCEAEVWDYTQTAGPNGEIFNTYFYKKQASFKLTNNPSAPRVEFFMREPIRKGVQFRELKDLGGKSIMPGAWYIVTAIEPIMNVFGYHEGYRLQAALVNEPTFEDA